MRENTMGPIQYLLAHLYWAWLFCMFFMARLFSPIISIHSGTFLTTHESQGASGVGAYFEHIRYKYYHRKLQKQSVFGTECPIAIRNLSDF